MTWDSAGKDAQITLSNGDLSASIIDTNTSSYYTCRSTTGFDNTAGNKKYVEISPDTGSGGFVQAFGITNAARTVYAGLRFGASGTGTGWASVGGVFTLANTHTYDVPTINQRMNIAIDFAAGKFFCGHQGSYTENAGTQDPAAGSNAAITWTPDGTVYYLLIAMWGDDSPMTYTVYPTSGTQNYSPPSGYSAWA